jgi:tetratricopeptide (TPR) repeat protein
LWTLRDGEALDALLRDEHDALNGAGRTAAAARALVEKARAALELRDDAPGAREALAQALELDPQQTAARLMLLFDAARANVRAQLPPLLEALGADIPSCAASLRYLALLLAEGQDDAAAVEHLMQAAPADERTALALVRRRLAANEALTPPAADVAAALAQSVAGLGGVDARLASALFVRAAGLEEAAGRPEAAEALLQQALSLEPEHLPALVRLRRLLLARSAFAPALDVIEAEARAARRPVRRAELLLTAATIADHRLVDRVRAKALLRAVLAIDGRHGPAFARLRTLLEEDGDLAGLAELLATRATGAPPAELSLLRLERADLLLGKLGARAAGKDELRALLAAEPHHLGSLARLAKLELEDGDHAAAAELSIRQARFERDPAALGECFLRIGRLHTRALPDPKLAAGAYERVLRLDPGNLEALEALSELYARQNDTRRALAMTERLCERESDPARRLPFLLRLATLWAAAGDHRRSGVVLKRAVDESPRSLQAIGELVRFHERAKETMARNVLLDGASALLRQDLRQRGAELETLRNLIAVLRWRQRRAGAGAAAQLLARIAAEPPAGGEPGAASGLRPRRLASLASPELEERAVPPGIPAGLRHVMRLIGPPLARASKPDLRRWNVGRAERQAGNGPRELAEPIAADLGVRPFELYVSQTYPFALAVEPGDPPALVLGAGLVALGTPAVRFAAAYGLRLIGTRFDLFVQSGPPEAAALLAGIIRPFVPDYHPPGVPAAVVEAAQGRVAKAMSKSLRAELGPFATEIAAAYAPEALFLDLQETAGRAGLLACGDLSVALEVLARAAGHPKLTLAALAELPLAGRLADFAFSEDHEELVLALDAVS